MCTILQSILHISVPTCQGIIYVGVSVCDSKVLQHLSRSRSLPLFTCLFVASFTSYIHIACEDHSHPPTPSFPPSSMSCSCGFVLSVCSAAPGLSPPQGLQRGGPLTVKATEASSQVIGSCVSGTETCRSLHFSPCFLCPPLLLLSVSLLVWQTQICLARQSRDICTRV